MPEVNQSSIDDLNRKLDTIIRMQIDIKKQIDDLNRDHNTLSFALRRKGPLNKR